MGTRGFLFLRAAGIFRVGQRPKLRAAEPREKKLFSHVALWMKTWQKSETAQEKSLSNRESFWFQWNSGPVLSIIFFSFGFHFEWIFVVDIFPCLIFFLFLPHLPAPITFPIVRPSSNRCKFKREEKLQRGLPVVSHTITIWKGRSCILLLHQI